MIEHGTCGYCLGAKTIVSPKNNDLKEVLKNNFEEHPCPVCGGTGEQPESEDTFEDDENYYEELYPEEFYSEEDETNDSNDQS